MNKLTFLLLLLAFNVQAQEPSIQAQRDDIAKQRAALEADFQKQEAACGKKFFVNRCLEPINGQRREAFADLRRQEVVLNDQERKQKSANQIKKIEEKASLENQQKAIDQRVNAQNDFATRQQRHQEKLQERAQAQQDAQKNVADRAKREQNASEKAQSRAGKRAQEAENLRKYQENQQKALEKKQDWEKKRLERGATGAASLPV